MAYVAGHLSKAIKELSEAGIIPSECGRFEMVAEPCKAVILRYEVFASEEQVQAIAEALIRNPEEARAIAQIIVFPKRGKDEVSVSVEV